MRRYLHLLTLVALLFAPLAAPAAAMAAVPSAAECADMEMEIAGHDMPAGNHGQGDACCIAVPPAIVRPSVGLAGWSPIEHLAFVAAIEPFRLGAGPKADDPPPRAA